MSTLLATEWCSNCDTEVEIPDNRISACPECGESIRPCSECNPDKPCYYNEEDGTCRMFPRGYEDPLFKLVDDDFEDAEDEIYVPDDDNGDVDYIPDDGGEQQATEAEWRMDWEMDR